jgi:NADPH-dependent 2,4-dienoyl-CoA reductase/sulfur reductase-like enzyme
MDPDRIEVEPTEPPARVRRELLAVGAAGAAALYLGLNRRISARRSYRGRVIVVGAGLAGLSAAWELECRGTATFCGYMEGALESGLRAARRIDAV